MDAEHYLVRHLIHYSIRCGQSRDSSNSAERFPAVIWVLTHSKAWAPGSLPTELPRSLSRLTLTVVERCERQVLTRSTSVNCLPHQSYSRKFAAAAAHIVSGNKPTALHQIELNQPGLK
jgi:hypothetical protein